MTLSKMPQRTVMARIALLLALMLFAAQALAMDISVKAKSEYKQCLRETKKARNECTQGGCGNIVASCYERQIAAIDQQNSEIFERLKQAGCEKSAEQLSIEFADFSERIFKLQAFDNTWSGFDLKVDVALLKNKALLSLVSECKSRASDELTPSS
jgi:uncharacterized membrane protein